MQYVIEGQSFEGQILVAGLYLVPTPIGNLKDITVRALAVLAACDKVFCEDTRVTRKLLSHYRIKSPLATYNDHNGASVRPGLIRQIKNGQAIALVADAGMPLISDPGVKLVRAAFDRDIKVTALPGPSAVVTALTASGLASDRFEFVGFVPAKSGARDKALKQFAQVEATLIVFETARRLQATLAAMGNYFAGRDIAVVREMTKVHEEIVTGTLETVAGEFEAREEIKGEIVLIIAPRGEQPDVPASKLADDLKALLVDHSTRDAAEIVAKTYNLPRRRVYSLALEVARDPVKGAL